MKHNINKTMMQYFEWYLKPNSTLWKDIAKDANYLDNLGITALWLPPAYKGSSGKNDVGYGVYDLYDLGEFDQKGSIETKYGTKEEYLDAIRVIRGNNIEVYADVVLNHKLGADDKEKVIAVKDAYNDRNMQLSEPEEIEAWTIFNFDARNNKYSDFKWNWTHFHGVDWDEKSKTSGIYKFYGKHWDEEVDKENGNFDYLMGADIDLNNVDVTEELKRWGRWYLETTNVDGFRLDAVKHIRADFFKDWLEYVRSNSNKELFTVGEYWSTNLDSLKNYIHETNSIISLFDVPLHYNFFNASHSNGYFDMRTIMDNSLVKVHPDLAVTFVDNHDTQPGQALCSWIEDWFKPLAYAIILLRKDGYPCVFYGDYYGIEHDNIEPKRDIIEKLIKARKRFAYGRQNDYLDNPDIIGWTREGDYYHPDSGLAVVMSDSMGGSKQMNIGLNLANSILYDCTGNMKETVYIDKDGNGIFYCNPGSVSVWIKKENMYEKTEENKEEE